MSVATLTSFLSGSGSAVFGIESHRGEILVRLLLALALTWAVGFERELRGAAAGDRTFALVGVGSALVGYLSLAGAPHALAGVLTGIGFVGGGVIFGHPSDEFPDKIHGITTAAALFLVASVGMAAGRGELLLATVAAGAALLLLEIRHLRWLRVLDGRNWRGDRQDPPTSDPGRHRP